ncbi:hypothetical protein PAXINDRAFT_57402, partial [Paxillus involutus ATCC 200175]
KSQSDGNNWMVSEDWEGAQGIINDLLTVDTHEPDETIAKLHKWFRDEPLLLEVIQAISNSNQSATVKDKRWAQHCAKFFFINDGKLWRMANDTTTRPHSRLECVPKTEVIELTRIEHASKGHWGRDLIKLQLMDHIYSPRLNRSITAAIL